MKWKLIILPLLSSNISCVSISTNSESSSLIKRKRSKLNKHPNLYIENSKLLYNKCSKYIKEEI